MRSDLPGRLAIAAAAVLAAAGIATVLVAAPSEVDRLRDDAFYEFAWAANVAAGRGPVVSDGVTTSGVQLLWSLLLVPVAWALGAASLPVVAPWLGFVLHLAAAAVWFFGVRDRRAGLVVALCWLGHPLLLREAQNGQETALAALLATALWFARAASARRFVALAVLAVLARTDLFALVLAIGIVRGRAGRAGGALGVVLALAAALAASRLLGGGWLPDSAAPMAFLWHDNHAAADPGWPAFVARQWWFLRPALLGGPFALVSAFGFGALVFFAARPLVRERRRWLPVAAVGAAAALGARDLAAPACAALLLAAWPARGARRVPWSIVLPGAALAAIVVLHWAVRWYPRDYYLAPLAVAATGAVVRLARLRVLLLAFAVSVAFVFAALPPEPLAGQRELTLAGRHLAAVTAAGDRIGCFNSGLVTFHADVLAAGEVRSRRAIVNLDGVVDARSFAALRERRLERWLLDEGVAFVLDSPVQFVTDPRVPHACGRYFAADFRPDERLVEVARFDVPGVASPHGDSVRLYWLRAAGPPPPRSDGVEVLAQEPDGIVVRWAARAGEALEIEQSAGGRRRLVGVDVDTQVVLLVPRAMRGTGRLFRAAAAEPLLTLPPL
jgi:hypothetical protein